MFRSPHLQLLFDQLFRWKKVAVKLPGLQELRDSLMGLTVACNDVNSDKWLSRLANTRWLSHVKEALNAACLAAQCLEKEDAPVMVVEQVQIVEWYCH